MGVRGTPSLQLGSCVYFLPLETHWYGSRVLLGDYPYRPVRSDRELPELLVVRVTLPWIIP